MSKGIDKHIVELLTLVADPKNWDFEPICNGTGVRFVHSWVHKKDIRKYAEVILEALKEGKENV